MNGKEARMSIYAFYEGKSINAKLLAQLNLDRLHVQNDAVEHLNTYTVRVKRRSFPLPKRHEDVIGWFPLLPGTSFVA